MINTFLLIFWVGTLACWLLFVYHALAWIEKTLDKWLNRWFKTPVDIDEDGIE